MMTLGVWIALVNSLNQELCIDCLCCEAFIPALATKDCQIKFMILIST